MIATLNLDEIRNLSIFEAFLVADKKINSPQYKTIIVSISGGADSDTMLDLIIRVDVNKKCRYVFFDTGLEYQATRKHLDELEQKYNIKIERYKPTKPIPVCCKEYGVPFWSKYVSEMICRLQKHNFEWKDEPYDVLIKKYPKCESAIKWWCNKYSKLDPEEAPHPSKFDINYIWGLKEFLIENPPSFKISNKCCYYAKKKLAHSIEKECDLKITGIRKSEGGVRATAYKNCFTNNEGKDGPDKYRPIFWFKDKDKEDYKKHFKLTYSDCYEKYGLIRTGCAGCPYNKKIIEELQIIKIYEPRLYKAAMAVFGKSYQYTQKFEEYRKKRKSEEKNDSRQISLFQEDSKTIETICG